MAGDPRLALAALHRFGLGALGGSPGEIARIAADPKGFVKAQLQRRAALALAAPELPHSDVAFRQHRAAEEVRRREREAIAKANAAAQAAAATQAAGAAQGAAAPPAAQAPAAGTPAPAGAQVASLAPAKPAPPKPPEPQIEQTIFQAEVQARFARLIGTENGFLERLVLFWSNHFAVSLAKGAPMRVLTGAFEREVIRPHVLGHFGDMLVAVEKHPTMLIYLDNNQSIGPASRTGEISHRGLNENLAREILELHTLGVDGGYSQADVTSLARIITGWTFVQPDDDALYGGRFTFAPVRHEPGPQVVLGKTYGDSGLGQGDEALADIARHPATAHHIAHKLARHFVADDPPPTLVDNLTKVFRMTDGDLYAVSYALIDAVESWDAQAKKLRSPEEFVVAAFRALRRPAAGPQIVNMMNALGQPLWYPPGPNGFADTVPTWASPKGMRARLDVAAELGHQAGPGPNPNELLDIVIGPAASADTRVAVSRAASRPEGLALLLMAPEFQRR
jgi:uncharacterized protein (DUF1800 family)